MKNSNIKNIVRKISLHILFPKENKIIIASSGRSGSTMLYYSLADSLILKKLHLNSNNIVAHYIKRLCTGFVKRIKTLPNEPYLVCKTHDIYDNPPKSNYKYIFIYGDPLDSAMSVEKEVNKKGLGWFLKHQKYLRAFGNYDDLYRKDIHNYKGQIENWLNQRKKNIFCVDYDDLWSEVDLLSKFVGFEVRLPPRRPRQDKIPIDIDEINENLFDQLKSIKDNLKDSYKSQFQNDPSRP